MLLLSIVLDVLELFVHSETGLLFIMEIRTRKTLALHGEYNKQQLLQYIQNGLYAVQLCNTYI